MRTLVLCILLAGCAADPRPGPNPQLASSVAQRLGVYGFDVAPEELTTSQAAALHLLLSSDDLYLDKRRKARTILTSERFRD